MSVSRVGNPRINYGVFVLQSNSNPPQKRTTRDDYYIRIKKVESDFCNSVDDLPDQTVNRIKIAHLSNNTTTPRTSITQPNRPKQKKWVKIFTHFLFSFDSRTPKIQQHEVMLPKRSDKSDGAEEQRGRSQCRAEAPQGMHLVWMRIRLRMVQSKQSILGIKGHGHVLLSCMLLLCALATGKSPSSLKCNEHMAAYLLVSKSRLLLGESVHLLFPHYLAIPRIPHADF